MGIDSSITFVIPCCNEEENVEFVVNDCIKAAERITDDYEIIVINDGSKDRTSEILESLKDNNKNLKIITHSKAIGCHPSQLEGFKNSTKDWMLFLPGDRQILAGIIFSMLTELKKSDVVVTVRKNRCDSWHRLLLTKSYNGLVRILFGLNYRDIDSSTLYKREAITDIVNSIDSDSAFIALELLYKANKRGLRISEVEIKHYPRIYGKPKGVNIKDLICVPLDLIKFRLKLLFNRNEI